MRDVADVVGVHDAGDEARNRQGGEKGPPVKGASLNVVGGKRHERPHEQEYHNRAAGMVLVRPEAAGVAVAARNPHEAEGEDRPAAGEPEHDAHCRY